MFRLIETIRLEDGVAGNLRYHQQRVDDAFRNLFQRSPHLVLEKIIREPVPAKGVYKCRIVYDELGHIVQYEPYVIRPVLSLKKIEDNAIEYTYKKEDRSAINELFSRRGTNDDVLIIKNGMVTDTSYANIVFKTKDNRWVTPSDCLLKGTMRQLLLDQKIITAQPIAEKDIVSFSCYKLINAMLRWDGAETDISNIV